MPTPQQSAEGLLSLWVVNGVGNGARPGRTQPFAVTGTSFDVARFPGVLQAAFLQAGYQISDLVAGLAYAEQQGWLSVGNNVNGVQEYVLEQAGFAEAGGTAPTQAASAQQLINVAAALNATPGGAQFNLVETMRRAFVGTVGSNTFAAEDLIPAYGYALAQGWVRPAGDSAYYLQFTLTAAGVAAAS